jgi:hypothetical protein
MIECACSARLSGGVAISLDAGIAFIDDLVREKLLDAATAEDLQEIGHPYFLFTRGGEVKRDNCFLIGDSAGLASVDLGEGIGRRWKAA